MQITITFKVLDNVMLPSAPATQNSGFSSVPLYLSELIFMSRSTLVNESANIFLLLTAPSYKRQQKPGLLPLLLVNSLLKLFCYQIQRVSYKFSL